MIGRFKTPAVEDDDSPKGFDDFDLRLGDVMRGERATLGKSLLDVQRELKIRATYIAAIENADPSAFETPGFIAGYVRSYARYLGLDPEWAWKLFCQESDFETAHGMSQAASSKRAESAVTTAQPDRDPIADPRFTFTPPGERMFSGIEPGAIGSMAVMLALIGVIGYGGYSVLKEVQKVEFVPVDQSPGVVSELDPLEGVNRDPGSDEQDEPQVAGLDQNSKVDLFERLYRPQALEVPKMTARDGPIAALDPASVGALAATPNPHNRTASATGGDDDGAEAPREVAEGPTPQNATGQAPQGGDVQVTADEPPEVVMLAVRPSWVRVRGADGTVLYEKIMEPGDRFELPQTEDPATLRTGESGAIYFAINGKTYGPVGRNGQVTGNLNLAAASLTEKYEVADMSEDADLRSYVAELDLGQEQPQPQPQADPLATE